tara:strand:+ start:170 stop:409 length:240 start_codon:yes stop_codon:yes gene_type:complete
MKLRAYQVGENDIVLAENESEAVKLLNKYTGLDEHDVGEVDDLSSRLDMKLSTEDGKFLCTLGDYIADMKEPQYVVGWE